MPPLFFLKFSNASDKEVKFISKDTYVQNVLQKRNRMLKTVLEYVQNTYLPGLKFRLAKWLGKCQLKTEYEETLPTERLGHVCLQEPVTRFIREAVGTWFEDEGYVLDTLWVSRYRLLLRISLDEMNKEVPSSSVESSIGRSSSTTPSTTPSTIPSTTPLAPSESSFHTVTTASDVEGVDEVNERLLGPPLKTFPFCFI